MIFEKKIVSYYMTSRKFSENLQDIMAEKGFTVSQLAKKAGIEYVLIWRWLKEDHRGKLPCLKNLIALACALRVSLEELTSLESLKSIEKEADAVGDLSVEEKAVLEAYNALSDDDWQKKAVDEILLKTKEVKKEKESGK